MRLLPVATFVASLLLSACSFLGFGPKEYEQNPDPNHTHADFAVWIEDLQIDFSDPKYMSGLSYDEESHDEEDEYHHEHLHLHDEVGDVLHRHKPGLPIGDFLASIGFEMSANCMKLDTGVHICPEQGKVWQMYVRKNPLEGNPWEGVPFDPDYIFEDHDQILLTYQGEDEISKLRIEKQQKGVTEESCLYSRTCPWRGDPPAENCVADPDVPCVAPLE